MKADKIKEPNEVKTSNKSNKDNITINPNTLNKEKNKEIPKRAFISIDNTYESVIQYQDEGYSIFFADGEGELLTLTEDQIKGLNLYNREKYRTAVAITNKTLDLTSVKESHMKFKPKASYASATNRLKVENQKPGMHYAWKRQDELQQVIYDGGRVCQDPAVTTFGDFDIQGKPVGEKDSTHYIQADGVIEQVLTETPEEIYKIKRDAIDDLSVRRNNAVDNTIKADLEAMGGNPDGVEKLFNK